MHHLHFPNAKGVGPEGKAVPSLTGAVSTLELGVWLSQKVQKIGLGARSTGRKGLKAILAPTQRKGLQHKGPRAIPR